MALNGNTILIYRGATVVAAAPIPGVTSHTVEVNCDTIEKASATQADHKEYVAGRKGWTIDVNCLVLTAAGIAEPLTVGNTYYLVNRDRTGSTKVVGQAILRQCKQTYTRGNLVAGNFSFLGSGALTQG